MIRNSENIVTIKFSSTLFGVTMWTGFFCVRLGSSDGLLEYNNERWYFVTFLEFLDELSGYQFIQKKTSINYDVDLSAMTRLEMCVITDCSVANAALFLLSALKICGAGLSKHSKCRNSKCGHTVLISLKSPLTEEFML